MTTESKDLLKNFFGAYFHEDWVCEADTADAVVDKYAKETSPEKLRALSEIILDYLKEILSDAELEERLFTDLGCYYLPSAQGLSVREWLKSIASRFQRQV
jgi:hypothetical protein